MFIAVHIMRMLELCAHRVSVFFFLSVSVQTSNYHDSLHATFEEQLAMNPPGLYTRQMMIIAGGEPELCRRRHAKREGGVYASPYALRVRKSCPESSVHVLCLCKKV